MAQQESLLRDFKKKPTIAGADKSPSNEGNEEASAFGGRKTSLRTETVGQ